MAQNRKRGRNQYEDEVEFMPLSKRINNLHINNGLFFDTTTNGAHTLPESPPESVQNFDWGPQYTPDLDQSQNPHYFNINKLLFEMYIARSQRAGHPA